MVLGKGELHLKVDLIQLKFKSLQKLALLDSLTDKLKENPVQVNRDKYPLLDNLILNP